MVRENEGGGGEGVRGTERACVYVGMYVCVYTHMCTLLELPGIFIVQNT